MLKSFTFKNLKHKRPTQEIAPTQKDYNSLNFDGLMVNIRTKDADTHQISLGSLFQVTLGRFQLIFVWKKDEYYKIKS